MPDSLQKIQKPSLAVRRLQALRGLRRAPFPWEAPFLRKAPGCVFEALSSGRRAEVKVADHLFYHTDTFTYIFFSLDSNPQRNSLTHAGH